MDYYVSFGGGRDWEDAREFGFVSGDGALWHRRTLEKLHPGDRVFVCIGGRGYVGCGHVLEPAVAISDFRVNVDGISYPLWLAPGFRATWMGESADDPDRAERVVAVEWIATVSRDQAIWESGMFANQNTACELRSNFTRTKVLAGLGLGQ